MWPVSNKTKLYADFGTEADANRFFSQTDGKPKAEEAIGIHFAVLIFKTEGEKLTFSKDTMKTLDDLFQKTVAKPQLYWLPLTEEQVEQKKKAAAEAKDKKPEERK